MPDLPAQLVDKRCPSEIPDAALDPEIVAAMKLLGAYRSALQAAREATQDAEVGEALATAALYASEGLVDVRRFSDDAEQDAAGTGPSPDQILHDCGYWRNRRLKWEVRP